MLKKGCVPSLNLPERLFEHPKQARAANHWSILRNAGCVQEETSEMTVDHSAHPETVEHAAYNTTLIGTTDNDECNGTNSEYLDTQQQQTQTWGTYRRHQLFSVNFLTEKQTKHFTGFSVQQFKCLLSYLVMESNEKTLSILSEADELFLTLLKYQQNFNFNTLAMIFDFYRVLVSNIFAKWTNILHTHISLIDFWSMCGKIEGKYDIVIDCNEIPVVKSSKSEIHQTTFYHYKNGNTFKGLVGVTETGKVLFRIIWWFHFRLPNNLCLGSLAD